MGVSFANLFTNVRQYIGFLPIFALLMPTGAIPIELESGDTAIVFIALIGSAGGFITFEGITFDFQIFSLSAFSTLVFWIYGLIITAFNIVILAYLWQYSLGAKNRKETLSSVIFLLVFAFVIGGFGMIPLPFVAVAVFYKVLTTPEISKPPAEIQEKEDPEAMYIERQSPQEPSLRRRLPKFYAHGLAFALMDLLFGLMWPIYVGIAVASGNLLGGDVILISIGLSFASIFIGIGLINAWIAERIWNIEWDYGLGILILNGIILFAVQQFMVNPLSAIVGIILGTDLVGVAIVFLFTYTAVAFVMGLVGLVLSFQFRPKTEERKTSIVTEMNVDSEERVDEDPERDDTRAQSDMP